jgi:hypothetical protein
MDTAYSYGGVEWMDDGMYKAKQMGKNRVYPAV